MQFREQDKAEIERKLNLRHWPLMTVADQDANYHLLGAACPAAADSCAPFFDPVQQHRAFVDNVAAASATLHLPGWSSLRLMQQKSLISSIQVV